MKPSTRLATWLVMLLIASAVRADDLFESKIQPLLALRCYKCHSHEQKIKGGLTLDSRSGWEQGGDSGPAILPGNPDKSLLIRMVRWADADHHMPPKQQLPADEVAALEQWVSRGAPDPRVQYKNHPTADDWWSLKPLVRPKLPEIAGAAHAANPIDHFILARLAEKKVAPSPPADRRTLIRRVYFDLLGLPPTPAEVDAFVNDPDGQAYERLVDRLLSSPQYGQRWARHWLDTIHFAETHGCEHDIPRADAWPYRDYVIESFNSDKPWQRFIREQLAADHFYPDEPQLIPALGYLGAGLFDLSAYTTAPTNFSYLDRDDLVTQTMGAFASTTANCARCHAHKFDPITQEDYYALQSVFAGVVKGNLAYDSDHAIASQRKHWQSLIAAASAQDKDVLLAPEYQPLIADFESHQSAPAKWTVLDYETFVSTDGSTLSRDGDALVAGGPKPDKDSYIITAAAPATKVTAIRLDVLADPTMPMKGPGRQDNGNLTLSEFDVRLFDPRTNQPTKIKLSRATADFNQQNLSAAKAIDGDISTGWGIHPAVGQSHYAVFELAEPLAAKPGARLVVTLKQLAGRSHLIGRFKLSATADPASQAVALPILASDALCVSAGKRTAEQRLALAAYAIGQRAEQEIASLPPQRRVFAAGKKVDLVFNVNANNPLILDRPKVVNVLKRGEFDKPLAEAESGSLSAITAIPSRFTSAHNGDESDRRAALADWLADERNPLTWRSIANRLWHYHFGRGICDSPNDFGRMGGRPSHPELLDWLACELRDNGGSLKHIHRLIMTSAAYRQSSESREDAAKIDADNRLLWRMNRLRLDADSYRDFVLATADCLDLTHGGPSVRQYVDEGLHPNYLAYDWASLPRHRRSIYRFVVRAAADPFMEAMDFPDLGMLAPARAFSASPLQSLALYNNPFVLHFSEELGKQIKTPDDAVKRILLRDATAEEQANYRAYADKHGLAALCRVLLNSNEFLFVN